MYSATSFSEPLPRPNWPARASVVLGRGLRADDATWLPALTLASQTKAASPTATTTTKTKSFPAPARDHFSSPRTLTRLILELERLGAAQYL